jgi:hypothetical protein
MAQGSEMETFKMWKAMLLNDLRTLKQLEGLDGVRHAFKEQEIGQHCCQAGESLTDAELALLKKKVRLTDQQWRAFKSKLLLVPE